MRPSQLLVALATLSAISSATSWSYGVEATHALYARQDDSASTEATSTADKPTSTATSEAARETDEASTTDKPDEASATPTGDKDPDSKPTDDASGSGSGSGSRTGTGTASKTSGKTKSTSIGFDVPAGGVAMITPAAIAGTQYYKIGDWVHFAWNYTGLIVTPSAVDVMATCTKNQATYTIAVNQTAQETNEVFWNTKDYLKDHPNSVPLLTEMYTLLIYDSNSTVSAPAKPGYLAPFNLYSFGLYAPQSYVPWANYTCANCNGGLSPMESLTLKALLITSATTMASLLYFSASFGLW